MATPSKPIKPTYEQLITFAAGNLPADQMRAIAAHVRNDPQAAATVAAYQAVRQTLISDDSLAPPHEAVARAQAIFHSRAAAAIRTSVVAWWIEAVDRLIAKIVYDSRLQPAAVRFADPSAADRINLTFEVTDGEVDLQAERMTGEGAKASQSAGHWRLMGQISDDRSGGAAGAKRELALIERGSSTPIAQITSDDYGGFSLDAPAGTYELLLRAGDSAIVLAPIELI